MLSMVLGLAVMSGSPAVASESGTVSIELEAAFPMLSVHTPRLWAVARVAIGRLDDVGVGDDVSLRLACQEGACAIEAVVPRDRTSNGTARLAGRIFGLTDDGSFAIVIPAPFPLEVADRDRPKYEPLAVQLLSGRYDIGPDGTLAFRDVLPKGKVPGRPVTWK